MLPPKPRLLKVIEQVDHTQVQSGNKTDRRYPHRRGLERATRSFVIYLLVARQFSDLAQPSQQPADYTPIPAPARPE